MVKIKPFNGIRPPREYAAEVASRPYDVLSSAEAKKEATERSLLNIIKPEICFDPIADEHADEVYAKAVENFKAWQERGWLVKDDKPNYYLYAQTMGDHRQFGLVACCHFEDYLSGAIKKHELTRPDKEEDRMRHVREQSANIEPVFFSYPQVGELDKIMEEVALADAEYDFVSEDGVGHTFWVIDQKHTQSITELFGKVPALYVADGHHRTAAAALVGAERKAANPNHKGDEEYCYFLAVIFPDNQLKIIDYNRTVVDLAGLSDEEFMGKVAQNFDILESSAQELKPQELHTFSIYLSGQWHLVRAKEGRYNDNDPIEALDVTVLSKYILDEVLGIKDLRKDKRIDFVGGIRGLGQLKDRVDRGDARVAFALYPVSMTQLINISDSGNIMPPKTTWFEPKLRSGLVIHSLD